MRVFALAAACMLAITAEASARAPTVDDLLMSEQWGDASITPDDRWLIFEKRGPYAAAPSFQGDYYAHLATSRLFLADLDHPGPATPLFPQDDAGGYVAGPISPDGKAVLVYRFEGESWRAGIAQVGRGEVRWLPVTPEYGILGRLAQWRSNRQLVFIVRPGGGLPDRLRLGWDAMAKLPELWARADRGQPSVTVIGSGPFSELREGPAKQQLVQFDTETGELRTIAAGAFADLELSSDGRYAAVLAVGEQLSPASVRTLRDGDTLQQHNVLLVDLENGLTRSPCSDCDVLPGLLAWAPTANKLLVFARARANGWTDGELYAIAANSGALASIARHGVVPTVDVGRDGTVTVQAAWLADAPVLHGRQRQSRRSDWYALGRVGATNLTADFANAPATLAAQDDQGLLFIADERAWSVDRQGRPSLMSDAASLSKIAVGAPLRLAINAPSRQSWLPALQESSRGAAVVRVARAGQFSVQDLPTGARVVAMSASTTVVTTTDRHGVSRLSVHRRGLKPFVARTINSGFAELEFADVRALRANPSARGAHWLYLPPGRQEGARLPLIVVPYPGAIYPAPPSKYAPGALTLYTNPQLLAARGYAVLVPSLTEPVGTSEPASGLTEQISAAVETAVSSGFADPRRIAIWGHSYGGYAALVAATRSERFGAIIVSAGISDLSAHWGAIPPDFAVSADLGPSTNWGQGWVEKAAGMGGPPWTDPERYARNSPFSQVDRISAPVLLIQGDQDSIALGQAQSVYSALYRQGKPAALATYWGEGHVISSPGNVRDMYDRVFSWLSATIGAPGRDTSGSRPKSVAAAPSRAPIPPSPRPAARRRRRRSR